MKTTMTMYTKMKSMSGTIRARLSALLAAALLAMTAGAPALAMDTAADNADSAKADALQEVMVEGRRINEGLSTTAYAAAEFGSQVQLITASEIDTGGFTNFGELASGLIRGANIGYSPDEGEFTIRIDGGSDRDTLLLLVPPPAASQLSLLLLLLLVLHSAAGVGLPLLALLGKYLCRPLSVNNLFGFETGTRKPFIP